MISSNTLNLGIDFADAVNSKSRTVGFTHQYYTYPARFSPQFVRAAIESFSSRGDVVIDPFMGSGTTLVEAMALGRHAIGSDINPLACLVAETKTSLLNEHDFEAIMQWYEQILPSLNLRNRSNSHTYWAELGYQKHVPWNIRRLIELLLDTLSSLDGIDRQRLVRCALLQTGKWSLDCKTSFPSVAEFKAKFASTLSDFKQGMNQLTYAASQYSDTHFPKVMTFNSSAEKLNDCEWKNSFSVRPKLVVTSPPYPGVHVLYHRWQINGRKETAAPFWIAGKLDGMGASYYTMGSRHAKDDARYFFDIQSSFSNVHRLLADEAHVVQLVAFSNIGEQFPKYLAAMNRAGFDEVTIAIEGRDSRERLWRQVPTRQWYASMRGETSSSQEVLLIHRKA